MKCREKKEDSMELIKNILKTHSWSWLGAEGKRIQRVLAGVDEEDEKEALKAWEKYFEKTLIFPFEAKVLGIRIKDRCNLSIWSA